jgi:hypothetical protein
VVAAVAAVAVVRRVAELPAVVPVVVVAVVPHLQAQHRAGLLVLAVAVPLEEHPAQLLVGLEVVALAVVHRLRLDKLPLLLPVMRHPISETALLHAHRLLLAAVAAGAAVVLVEVRCRARMSYPTKRRCTVRPSTASTRSSNSW